MSRAWDSAVNAELVGRIQKIVTEWQAHELTDYEAISQIADEVEIAG